MNINVKNTLGEIVAAYPSTVKVMNKYKFDYCCNGKNTLEQTLNGASVNTDVVLSELEEQTKLTNNQNVVDWRNKSLSQIVDYILNKHHTFMKATLEELNILMFRILKVHYKKDGESLLKIHKLFGTLKTELEAHLVKEEENLFPLIYEFEETRNEGTRQAILKFITDTENEHDAAGDLLKALEAATNDFTAPADACWSYKRTFELLDALEKDTFNHIHMENTILFGMI